MARKAEGGALSWYGTDRQGTVRQIFDNSGDETHAVEYDAFGLVLNGASVDRYGFQGGEHDPLTKLISFGVRDYNGQFWMTPDPIGFAGGDANLSRIVGNGPTNGRDPSGLSKDDELPCGTKLQDHDKQIAKVIKEVEDELEAELKDPKGWRPQKNDPGSYGKELERRVFEKIKDDKARHRSRLNPSGWTGNHHSQVWHHNITIDKETGEIVEINGDGGVYDKNKHVQIDIMRTKPGYEPKKGEKLDPDQIEDIYDIKSNRDGNLGRAQKEKLKSILNGGDPNGKRKVKVVHSRFRQGAGKVVKNEYFVRAIKAFSVAGGLFGPVGSIMAMIRPEEHNEQFELVVSKMEKFKNNKNNGINRHLDLQDAVNALVDYMGVYFEGCGLDPNALKDMLWKTFSLFQAEP